MTKTQAISAERVRLEHHWHTAECRFRESLTDRGFTDCEIEEALAVHREVVNRDAEIEGYLVKFARWLDEPDAPSHGLH